MPALDQSPADRSKYEQRRRDTGGESTAEEERIATNPSVEEQDALVEFPSDPEADDPGSCPRKDRDRRPHWKTHGHRPLAGY